MATISKVKPAKCRNCEKLERELEQYKHAFLALEKLAQWYDSGNALASAHRVREAMNGTPPISE